MKKERKRKNHSVTNRIKNIILVFALVVFALTLFWLVKIGNGYRKGQNEYREIRRLVLEGEDPEDTGARDEQKNRFCVDFEQLFDMNPDTAAWIRFYPEPSVISYPVVKGRDNEEYLHRTFLADENTLGTIFVNVHNSPDFTDKNTVIYGHRMKDGSMFRHLSDYRDKTFWEKNPYFYIYTPDGYERKYEIYTTAVVEDMSETYQTQFESEEAFLKFVAMTEKTAEYDTGVSVGAQDMIVTLSTCTGAGDTQRYVVRGVLKQKTKPGEE